MKTEVVKACFEAIKRLSKASVICFEQIAWVTTAFLVSLLNGSFNQTVGHLISEELKKIS